MKKLHILVVDDSQIVRMDLRGALMAAGFDVTACATKQAAIELLGAQTFDAVVLDVVLPDGSGVEILQQLRTVERTAATPAIMLSNEADVQNRVRGLSQGANEYVGKPYNIAYFIRRLRELCHVHQGSHVPPPTVIGCRRILAVDDSSTYLQYIAEELRKDGHDVVLARSGHEALDMLGAQTIDCVLLDLQMPGIDGLETLKRLRQTTGRESTPTLMITSSADPIDEQRARAAGIDDFLSKEVPFEVIRAKIHNLLRGRHTDQSRAESRRGSMLDNNLSPVRAEASTNRTITKSRFREPNQEPSLRRSLRGSSDCSPLFVEVASAMGLSGQLARDTLAKTLGRLDIDPGQMTQEDLARAMPAIRRTLDMFFSSDEVSPRVNALVAIANRSR